jgi:hypothetical protein
MARCPKYKVLLEKAGHIKAAMRDKSLTKRFWFGALLVVLASGVGFFIVKSIQEKFQESYTQLMISNKINYTDIKNWQIIVQNFNSFQYPVTFSIHPAETFELTLTTDVENLKKLQAKLAKRFENDFLEGLVITDTLSFLWYVVLVIVFGFLLRAASKEKIKGVSAVVWF